MIKIDGSFHEGGGQIVRTALALSVALNKGFIVENIRKGRKQPGLKAQHVHCIKALTELTNADVEGGELGSTRLRFIPRKFKAKTLTIDIGTAGSISLLLQAILLPCMLGKKPITLTIKGGTDGKWAMPVDYFKEILLPQLQKFAKIECQILKRGYYPTGGGEIILKIKPMFSLDTLEKAPAFNLKERFDVLQVKGVSHAARTLQEAQVAERQAKAAEVELQSLKVPTNIQIQYPNTTCPGSGIVLWAQCGSEETDHQNPVLLGGDALGEKGKKAEAVGIEAAKQLKEELALHAPVDSHLADNLLPFLAMYGGEIKVTHLTPHTETNIYTIEKFLGKVLEIKNNTIKKVQPI